MEFVIVPNNKAKKICFRTQKEQIKSLRKILIKGNKVNYVRKKDALFPHIVKLSYLFKEEFLWRLLLPSEYNKNVSIIFNEECRQRDEIFRASNFFDALLKLVCEDEMFCVKVKKIMTVMMNYDHVELIEKKILPKSNVLHSGDEIVCFLAHCNKHDLMSFVDYTDVPENGYTSYSHLFHNNMKILLRTHYTNSIPM